MTCIPTPAVLECMHFVSEGFPNARRIVLNYEFDLYLGGERKIVLGGIPYSIEEGSLVFRRPGQLTTGKGDYNMYLLTLDFFHTNESTSKLFRGIDGDRQPISDFQELDIIPPVFKPRHYEELKNLYKQLSHCSFPGPIDMELQTEYIKEFLLLVLYDAQIHNRETRFEATSPADVTKQVQHYISEHFFEPICIRDLAAMHFLIENYLIRTFKQKYQITPNQYLLETRLIHARYLLLYTDQTITEVALSCGFSTPSYFIKKFRERFQKTPLTFRRKNHSLQK